MEDLQFMDDFNPVCSLLKRLCFEEANQLLTRGTWKGKISNITFNTNGTYKFLSTAVGGPERLTVVCPDLFYIVLQKSKFSEHPDIYAPGTNSHYILTQQPQHPLYGHHIPKVIAKKLRLANFSYDTRVVFGSYANDGTAGDYFLIESPYEACHIMLILSEEDVKHNQNTYELLQEWSEFSYTIPRGGYYYREYAFILPIGFELCPKKSNLTETEISEWMERFVSNANAAYRDKCLHSLQLELINLSRTSDPIDEELENQVLAIAKQLAHDVVDPDDSTAWFHLQAYTNVAIRILNARLRRLDSLQISSYFFMDDTCQIKHNGSPFTIDEGLALIDRLKVENATKAAEKEVEAIKQDAKAEFEPKFKEFAPRLKALGGWMRPANEGMRVYLPRTEFLEDQKKAYRVTTFGYCETGLDKFITNLENEEKVKAEAKLRNDAALQTIHNGTALLTDGDRNAKPASTQPTKPSLWARFAYWLSHPFKNIP